MYSCQYIYSCTQKADLIASVGCDGKTHTNSSENKRCRKNASYSRRYRSGGRLNTDSDLQKQNKRQPGANEGRNEMRTRQEAKGMVQSCSGGGSLAGTRPDHPAAVRFTRSTAVGDTGRHRQHAAPSSSPTPRRRQAFYRRRATF